MNCSSNPMDWNFGEADIHPADQEILIPLCNPKFQYRVHSNLPVNPVVCLLNSVHILFHSDLFEY